MEANWDSHTNWLETDTPCTDWAGVTCDAGHVSGLDLYANGLSGALPTTLGDLTYLTALELDENSLTGGIPTTFGGLSSLLTLGLSYNSLRAEHPYPTRQSFKCDLALI